MDEITDIEQLEELESLLYSQIHYTAASAEQSVAETLLPELTAECSQNISQNMSSVYSKPRYFGSSVAAHAMQQQILRTLSSHENSTNVEVNTITSEVHIHQPVHFKIPPSQLPTNNYVFVAPSSTLTRNQRRKLRKQEKKSHEMTIQKAVNDAEMFRHLNPVDRARVIKMQKRQRYLARRKEKQKLLKEQELIKTYNDNIKNSLDEETITKSSTSLSERIATPLVKPMEVIELSETDEDEVVVLEENYETVCLSSDEEIKCKPEVVGSLDTSATLSSATSDTSAITEGDDSSIQFVEMPAPPIINIDVESETQIPMQEDVIKPSLENEITSLSSNASAKSSDNSGSVEKTLPLTPRCSTRYVGNRRHSDLVNTPESSNDFLDTTLDVMQQNFNFSLHENDLGATKVVLKPRTLADTYESESSCSTSDISSMKNPVFNELEFDSPSKQLFFEADLGSFSEFITPKRKLSLSTVVTSNAETENKDLPCVSTDAMVRNSSDSDSSSESELDEASASTVSASGPKRRRLPSLSHFDVDDSSAKSTRVLPKVTPNKSVKKKQTTIQNKFDFIKDAADETMAEQVSTPSSKKIINKRKIGSDKSLEELDLRQIAEFGEIEGAIQGSNLKRQKNKLVDTDNNKSKSQETILQRDEDGNNRCSQTDIDVSLGKKRRLSKSKSDTEVEKSSKSPTKTVKQNVNRTNSDSEVISQATDLEGQNINNDESNEDTEHINTNNKPVESPTKRRKRKSKSDTKTDEPTLIITTKILTDDETEETNQVHVGKTTDESENFNKDDSWDVQVIEEPLECIDVSSGGGDDDDSDEAIYSCKELKDLKTELVLSNIDDTIASVPSVQLPAFMESDFTQENEVEEPKSWCTRSFNMEQALRKMSDDPRKWRIMERDRIHIAMDSDRGIRCKKCREFGHRAYQCVRLVLRCWLCGEQTHQEPRCPNTICTNCGRKTRFFTSNCGRCKDVRNNKCNYCKVIGHLNDLCPDVWRRYHLTTEAGKIIAQTSYPGNKVFKSVDKRWCSGCGRSGHFEHTCNYYNRTHQRITPCVYEYEDLFKKPKSSRDTTAPEHSRVLRSSNRCAKETAEPINHKGNGGNTNSVHHKQVEMCHALTSEAKQMLETAAGKAFLNSLFEGLNISYDITVKLDSSTFLILNGYPTDLLIVSEPIRHFLANTTMSSRIITYSQRDFSIIQSHIEWLKQNEDKFAIAIEFCLKRKQLKLNGNVFGILLAEHNINRSLSEKGNDVEEKFTLLPDALCTVRRHPKMKVYAQKCNIHWSLEKSILILRGNLENVLSFRKLCGSFNKKPGIGSYPLLKITNSILKYAEYAPEKVTDKLLNTLLKNREYYALNGILFSKGKELILIRNLKNRLEKQLFLNPRSFARALNVINIFKIARDANTYLKCVVPTSSEIADLNAIDTSDLYNVDDLLTVNRKTLLIKLTRGEMRHLLETEEGKDFLNELKSTYNAVEKQGDFSLHFACNESNHKKVADYVRFYFLCLNMPFPSTTSNILDFLVKRLATAKLNYYTTSCRLLYQTMHRPENAWQVEQFHGLLFAHYELLEGLKHKETVMKYLKMLPHMKVDPVKLIRDYRQLKMSALHLFCPVLMDIDYKILISVAVPPMIHPIPLNQIKNTYTQVTNQIRYGYETLGNAKNSVELAELDILGEYLRKNDYSNESLEVASMFLKESSFEPKLI